MASKSPKASKKTVKKSDEFDDLFGETNGAKVAASSDIINKIEDEMDRDGGAFSSRRVNKVVFNPNDDLFATQPLSSAPKQQKPGDIFDDLFSDSAMKAEPKPSVASAGLFSESPKPKKATKPAGSSIFDNPPEDIFASPPRDPNSVDIFAKEEPSTMKMKPGDAAIAGKSSQMPTQTAMETGGAATGEAQSQEVTSFFKSAVSV